MIVYTYNIRPGKLLSPFSNPLQPRFLMEHHAVTGWERVVLVTTSRWFTMELSMEIFNSSVRPTNSSRTSLVYLMRKSNR